MTVRLASIFAAALFLTGAVLAPQAAQAGGVTSGHNIIQMNGTIVKRGGEFVQSGADGSLPGKDAGEVVETGGAPSPSSFDPTSGHNIVQMSGTIVKRGGVFAQSQASPGRPSDKCWCDDGIGSCGLSDGQCTPVGGDLGCTGICRASKK